MKLLLRNFQIHRHLEVDLSSSITSIIGDTDVGKSSIVRALRWLVFNEPSGESFRRRGSKYVRVSLYFDQIIVSRYRGPKGNQYTLTVDGKKQTFRAFHKGIPPEISKCLALAPINFQFQHDPAFWFAANAGDVSRELNQIVDLGIIDESLTKMAQTVRVTSQRVLLTKERLGEAQIKVKALHYAQALDADLRQLETSESMRAGLQQTIEELRKHVATVEAAQRRKESLGSVPVLTTETYDACRHALRQHTDLHKAYLITMETRRQQRFAEIELTKAEARLQQHTKGRCPLCGKPK